MCNEVTKTTRRQREGIPSQLAELEIGETVSLTRVLPLTEATPTAISNQRRLADLTLRKSVSRAELRTGFKYQLGSGEFRANDKFMIVATATRIDPMTSDNQPSAAIQESQSE